MEVDNTATKRIGKVETNEKGGPNRLKRDLMFFWGQHSTGRFDERTIRYAIDFDAVDVSKELKALVDAGIVETEDEKGVKLYRLTTNDAKRNCIIEAARPGHSAR